MDPSARAHRAWIFGATLSVTALDHREFAVRKETWNKTLFLPNRHSRAATRAGDGAEARQQAGKPLAVSDLRQHHAVAPRQRQLRPSLRTGSDEAEEGGLVRTSRAGVLPLSEAPASWRRAPRTPARAESCVGRVLVGRTCARDARQSRSNAREGLEVTSGRERTKSPPALNAALSIRK